jgi:hypothetical protein
LVTLITIGNVFNPARRAGIIDLDIGRDEMALNRGRSVSKWRNKDEYWGKGDNQVQQKHSHPEIEIWQQTGWWRTAKPQQKHSQPELKDGSRVSEGGQPSTAEAFTNWNWEMTAGWGEEGSQAPQKHSQPEIEGWQQGEQRRTAKHNRSTHILKLRNGSRVRKGEQPSTAEALTNWNWGVAAEWGKENSQAQQKHSLTEIEGWQQSKKRRTGKHSRSTHFLKLRDRSRVRKGGQPSTAEALTHWKSGMAAEW